MPNLLDVQITTPVTGYVQKTVAAQGEPEGLSIQAKFTYGGSGGETVRAWVQTTVDGNSTWADVANFYFETTSATVAHTVTTTEQTSSPFDVTMGALSDNTVQGGFLGPSYRVYLTTTGTYGTGTSLKIDFAKRT